MKCANGSGEHAANWSRCPKHPNNSKRKNKNKNKNENGPKPKNNNSKNKNPTPQAPRLDISKARKVSPNLDYSKVVQNLIPREHVSPPPLLSPPLHRPLETWLKPGINPQIANYRLFKDDRIEFPQTGTRGGRAIYCKSEIVHNRVPLPEMQGMEATALQIKIKNFPPINIVSANENIELAISELNQNFSEAFVEARKPKFKNAPKILSPEIKSKIHQHNRLRKFWQRTRCSSIYSEFRTLSREIAKDIQSHSRTQWEKHIEALSPVDNTLWRKSSLLRKPFHPIPPLQGALGSIAVTPIEKADVITDSLQEQFEPNHVVGREEFDQRIHEKVENFLATPHVQEILNPPPQRKS
ncbi:RNA-directed DNA polymerase from mobile element jockey [Trichonephila clavipes]|nr:RNA-directed DNA polymerase from mobile element jockey [Trichonephila clavipes]